MTKKNESVQKIVTYLGNISAILPIVIGLLFLAKILDFIHINPQFYNLWDWPGHIDKALKLGWPWQGGWDTSFWGGYPTLTYPFLSHYLAKLFLTLGSNRTYQMGAFVLALFTFQMFAFWRLITKRITNKSTQILAFTLYIMITFLLPGEYLGTYLGTLVTGGFSANLALSFLFLLVASDSLYAQILFGGLLLLTHTLTAFVGMVYICIPIIEPILKQLISHRRLDISPIITPMFVFILVLGIGSPWLIPFIDPNFQGQAANVPTASYLTPLIVLIPTIVKSYFTKRTSRLDYLQILLASFIIIFSLFNSSLTKLGFQGLHLFRFNYPLLTFAAINLLPWVFTPVIYSPMTALIIFTTSSLGLILYKLPNNPATISFDQVALKSLTGRIINIHDPSLATDYPHIVEHAVVNEPHRIGSTGLFFESSPLGLQYYELANQINPNSFKNGMYIGAFRTASGSSTLHYDVDHLADVIGVNAITQLTNSHSTLPAGIFEIGKIQFKTTQVSIIAKQVNTTPLITVLSTIPAYHPKLDLGQWWIDNHAQGIYTNMKIDDAYLSASQPTATPSAEIVDISPTTIDFSINSNTFTPVVLKFTYNKYWTTQALNASSQISPPYWVSPGQILVLGYGQLRLTWRQPSYEKPLLSVSFLLIAYCLYRICKPHFRFSQKKGG